MKTNDVLLFGFGLILGCFLKSNWNKRNIVVEATTDDTNYVFSQKYKDCEKEVAEFMTMAKFAQNTDLVAYKKNAIEECMKKV